MFPTLQQFGHAAQSRNFDTDDIIPKQFLQVHQAVWFQDRISMTSGAIWITPVGNERVRMQAQHRWVLLFVVKKGGYDDRSLR